MPKFFTGKDKISGNSLYITGPDVDHITRVYRAKAGFELTVCDGDGTDYLCSITSIDKERIEARLISVSKSYTEPNVKVTIFQGLPKQGKMETIIQKCTELGVSRIVPTITHRSVVKLSEGDTKKQQRWQKIAQEAAKQCGRGRIPEVTPPVNFKQAVEMASQLKFSVIPYEEEQENSLHDFLRSDMEEIGIIIGSEGGFEPAEVQLARENGIASVTLGRRILRTETVGPALLPIILYETGNM